jgi:hypothetical protein
VRHEAGDQALDEDELLVAFLSDPQFEKFWPPGM